MSIVNEHLVRQQYITQQQDHVENVIANLKAELDNNQRALRELGKLYLQSVADYEAEQAWAKYDPEGAMKPLVKFVAARLESAPSICKGERRWRTRNILQGLAKGRFPQDWTNQFEGDGNLAALHLQVTYNLTAILQNDSAKGSIEFKNALWQLHYQLGTNSGRYYEAARLKAEGERT